MSTLGELWQTAEKTSHYFSTQYQQCRDGFLAQMRQLPKSEVRSFSCHIPQFSDCAIDAFIFDPKVNGKDARKALVLISGTHGVEGYAGSAVQQFLLQQLLDGEWRLANDTALVMIHALNPWGMQWARRCDQDGIDLNRNFVDFSALPKPHPETVKLLNALQLSDAEERKRALKQLEKLLGQTEFEKLFSGGQYQHSWAPFYGGRQAAFSSRVLDKLINDWQLADRELVVFDLHTGLGPYGFGELISDHPATSRGAHYAQQVFGHAVAQTDLGMSFSVPKAGLLDYRWHALMQQRGCFLTLEFGTLGTESLFEVLLGDHQIWHANQWMNKVQQNADTQQELKTNSDYLTNRNAILNHFCPDDGLWQQAVLFKSWQCTQQVMQYFSETPGS